MLRISYQLVCIDVSACSYFMPRYISRFFPRKLICRLWFVRTSLHTLHILQICDASLWRSSILSHLQNGKTNFLNIFYSLIWCFFYVFRLDTNTTMMWGSVLNTFSTRKQKKKTFQSKNVWRKTFRCATVLIIYKK